MAGAPFLHIKLTAHWDEYIVCDRRHPQHWHWVHVDTAAGHLVHRPDGLVEHRWHIYAPCPRCWELSGIDTLGLIA